MGIEIQWTDSLESLAKVLYDSAIDVGAVCACVMTSRGCSFVLFRLQPTWCLGRGVQKCGYISRKKTTTGPLAVLAKRLFRLRGGKLPLLQNICPYCLQYLCENVAFLSAIE